MLKRKKKKMNKHWSINGSRVKYKGHDITFYPKTIEELFKELYQDIDLNSLFSNSIVSKINSSKNYKGGNYKPVPIKTK